MKISEVVSPETERPSLFSLYEFHTTPPSAGSHFETVSKWQRINNWRYDQNVRNVNLTIGALKNLVSCTRGFKNS
jgi:hypothetical protein